MTINEFESSFSLHVDIKTRDLICEKLKPIYSYYTYYFKKINDHLRCVNGKFQIKKVLKANRTLKILEVDNTWCFVPFSRKHSTECDISVDPALFPVAITSSVYRQILIAKQDVRISLDTVFDDTGADYYLAGEIEYPVDVFTTYTKLEATEAILWGIVTKHFSSDVLKMSNADDIMPEECLAIPSRRFHLLAEGSFRIEGAILKFKFDGHKAKIVINSAGRVLYIDDLYQISEKSIPELAKFKRLIFQLEIIPNEKLAVITDIIGYRVKGLHYFPEPKEVLSFLVKLNFNKSNFKILIEDESYNLKTQFPLEKVKDQDISVNRNHPVASASPMIDGLIAIFENREYKYKFPTLDVTAEIKPNFIYAYVDKKMIGPCIPYDYAELLDAIKEAGVEIGNAVFEICRCFEAKVLYYKILRLRKDRQYSASEAQLEAFIAENQMIEKALALYKT